MSPGVANSHRVPGGKPQTTLVLTIDARDQDKRNTRLVSLPLTAYDAAVACDIIFSCMWTAENNFMPKPTKHGMYVHEKDECLWIPGMVQTQKQDITVPGGLLLMEGQTPPTSPTTTHHVQATFNHVRQQWMAREKEEKLSYHLKLWDLHTEPVHLGMWFPDIPGLAENNDLDSLVVDLLHYVTTQLQQATPTACIRYVQGFHCIQRCHTN